MKILILIFDNYTALDIVGPYEVLNRLPGSEIFLVGTEKKVYKDTHGLKISADFSIDEVNHSDILLIPGGFGIDNLLKDIKILNWIREVNKTTEWTVSVCSGSLLLAETGLIDGKSCTTHWRRKDQLRMYNVNVRDERYVQDGKFITSAGVSSGIDMALFLVGKIAGEEAAKMIQLSIEYDPKPPFDYVSPEIS
jgi:transcriptional regulator GlxA family with amidase domain